MCLECDVWLLHDPVVGHNTRFDTRINLETSTRDMVQGWIREVNSNLVELVMGSD